MSHPVRDLTDQVFHDWHVLSFAGRTLNKAARWKCRCRGCGTTAIVRTDQLTSGNSRSCRDCAAKRRGYTTSPKSTFETRRRIVEMNLAGIGDVEIAKALGVHPTTVYRVLDMPASQWRKEKVA